MAQYVSLHNHTYFSILNSLTSPKELIGRTKELGQTAIGLTDYGNLAGVWDAYKLAKAADVKLIAGCEFYFTDDVTDKADRFRYVVLLATNATGYQNLLKLNRRGFEHASVVLKKSVPVIDWKMMAGHSSGLICLTGCGNGITGQLLNDKRFDDAESTFVRLKAIFGERLGAEVQTHNLTRNPTGCLGPTNQAFTNAHTIRLAQRHGIRIVPTNNSHYVNRSDAEVFDTTLAIASMQPVYSNNRLRFNTPELYMKSHAEVLAFFSRLHSSEFAQQLIDNTAFFADMCEPPLWIDPKHSNPTGKELPVFDFKSESDYLQFCAWKARQSMDRLKLEDDKLFLRFRCEKLYSRRCPMDKATRDVYRRRIDEELDVFYHCGSSSYMLIAADYIEWAWKNGATISPGRGSVGCSLVAYILGIHLVDPIKYGLPFERFYSKLRTSFADIDADFQNSRREDVLRYIVNKYGAENVAQITNNIYITPKVYVRDLSRSCDLAGDRTLSVKLGDDIADIIPKKDGVGNEVRTYQDIVRHSPLFTEYVTRYPKLAANQAICGKPRSMGLHAAGIVIGQRPLDGIVPTRVDKDGIVSVQFDKDRVEEVGLVKLDILGLSTLDLIEETNKLIVGAGKEVPRIDYEAYDEKTYDLISAGDTFCVFQFGTSGGTIDLCRKIKPKTIEDLAVITTLARPSSKEIRADFIKRREGSSPVRLITPKLANALGKTYGYAIYDEQLLTIAKDIAGWDLGEADKLRKLTKEKGKNPEKAERWRLEFIDGAVKNGVASVDAIKIWAEVISPLSSYSFNFSHALEYSMLSMHTAFLKAHFPIEFLLANLKSEIGSNAPNAAESVDKIKHELRRHGINILPPNVNTSPYAYRVENSNTLLTGLDALKFVGSEGIADIIEKRPFVSFDDFMLRADPHKVSAGTIKALAASGALDCFGLSRRLMFLYCSDYRKKLQVWLKRHNPMAVIAAGNAASAPFAYPWPIEPEWSKPELYALEKHYLGEVFVCGKVDAHPTFFRQRGIPFSHARTLPNRERVSPIKAEIKSIFEFKVKKETSKFLGQSMIKATIEDSEGDSMTLTVFPTNWKEAQDKTKQMSRGRFKFEPGCVIHLTASVNEYEDEKNLILEELISIAPAPALPKDLKAKKTSIRKKSTDASPVSPGTDDTLQQIEAIEDDLFFGGHIELETDDSD